MTPDQIREILLQAFGPQLEPEQRSDGWSFFYGGGRHGNRIITVRQSNPTASLQLLRAISNRLGRVLDYAPFEGHQSELRAIVEEEIGLYLQHYAEANNTEGTPG